MKRQLFDLLRTLAVVTLALLGSIGVGRYAWATWVEQPWLSAGPALTAFARSSVQAASVQAASVQAASIQAVAGTDSRSDTRI